jgi:hypothetical protein
MMIKNKIFTYIALLLVIILVALPVGGSNIVKQQESSIYHHFGNFIFEDNSIPNTVTSFELWITRENISEDENNKSYLRYTYKYKLVGLSKSIYYDRLRNTFMEEFEIFLDDSDEPMNNFPLNLYINKYPSVLYEMKSNDENPSFYISWFSSYYDPRE